MRAGSSAAGRRRTPYAALALCFSMTGCVFVDEPPFLPHVDVLVPVDGKVCTKECNGSCPTGWACGQLPSAGFTYVCQPNDACKPCKSQTDCKTFMQCAVDTDVDGSVIGSFCLQPCKATTDCSSGFACSSANVCVPQSGTCGCRKSWGFVGFGTECSKADAFGTCMGERHCAFDQATQITTLTACSAPSATTEICGDSVDNNCNGLTDEAGQLPCVTAYPDADGDGWGAAAECLCATPTSGYAAQGGDCNDHAAAIYPGAAAFCDGVDANCDGTPDTTASATLCADASPCTADGCDPTAAQCVHKWLVACTDGCLGGGACDDGDACTADLCTPFGCVFKVLTCDDANPCTADACTAGVCGHTAIAGCK
jgi:hypothetical protein